MTAKADYKKDRSMLTGVTGGKGVRFGGGRAFLRHDGQLPRCARPVEGQAPVDRRPPHAPRAGRSRTADEALRPAARSGGQGVQTLLGPGAGGQDRLLRLPPFDRRQRGEGASRGILRRHGLRRFGLCRRRAGASAVERRLLEDRLRGCRAGRAFPGRSGFQRQQPL